MNVRASRAIAAVNTFYEAYGREDIAGMRAIIAPDCRWAVPGHHPLSGVKVGRDEVVAYFDLLRDGNFKAEIIYLAGDDEHAIDVHRGWGAWGMRPSIRVGCSITPSRTA